MSDVDIPVLGVDALVQPMLILITGSNSAAIYCSFRQFMPVCPIYEHCGCAHISYGFSYLMIAGVPLHNGRNHADIWL